MRLRRPRHTKKALLICAVIIFLAALVAYGLHQLNSPAEGTIAKPSQQPAQLTDSTDYSTLDNSYISLLYPSNLNQNYHAVQTGALEYSYLNDATGGQSSVSMEVYVKPLPAGGITLDGDYKAYAANSRSYKASRKIQGNDFVDLFSTEANGKERNGLWAHGRYLLVIKLHGAAKGQDINQQFNTILGSVRWHKQ